MPDLSIPGHPNVFVVGDMAAVEGVPGMAQGAIQGAKYVATTIKSELKGADPFEREPFEYFDKGSMATISRNSAVAKIGPLEFGGYIAWLAWLFLHLDLSGRLPAQDHHADLVDRHLSWAAPRPADHHRAAGIRPHSARGTRGDRRGRRRRKSGQLAGRRSSGEGRAALRSPAIPPSPAECSAAAPGRAPPRGRCRR